ncbi:MAG: RNA ligase family protein [Anaerobutyricum hallii]|uniref:RNA ligase family protein n=1 Tax=Anaerobutyricum hallii TaxID=39488 RepID=UPI002A7F3B5D|nr:RNA ligase family protein [Anaerobutyricum hallii]MDY4577614.1 RNA ligase family protein [Anaerobutyricum hallii]
MIDASIEKITNIIAHPNADRLEIATICGYPVIVSKGIHQVGEFMFYIREDAQLSGDSTKFPWQESANKYTSKSNRVKAIKLRGLTSMGLALSLTDVGIDIKEVDSINEQIHNQETGQQYLLDNFGITHYSSESDSSNLTGKDMSSLPFGLSKSDETNVQEFFNDETGAYVPWNQPCLVTKKLDGSSMMIVCTPSGEITICSRNHTINIENTDSRYVMAAESIIPLARAYASHYNRIIALRGELTASNVQAFNINQDRLINEGKPTFNLYGCNFPELPSIQESRGFYGTDYHFLKVNEQIKELTGQSIRMVPVLETDVPMTKDLCMKYINMPKSFGEGVVFNFSSGIGSCKAKSLDYICKQSEVL